MRQMDDEAVRQSNQFVPVCAKKDGLLIVINHGKDERKIVFKFRNGGSNE